MTKKGSFMCSIAGNIVTERVYRGEFFLMQFQGKLSDAWENSLCTMRKKLSLRYITEYLCDIAYLETFSLMLYKREYFVAVYQQIFCPM